MGTTAEKASYPRTPRAMTQWLFRPYWRRVRIQLGDRVYVSISSRRAVGENISGRLRFWGKIHCAEGYWAGVELDLPHGQNDGSVDGHRYFLCHPNRGLFVRMSRCRIHARYGVGDKRHVLFPSRTLGKRIDGDGCRTCLVNRRTSFFTAAHDVQEESSPPYLCRCSLRDSTCLASDVTSQASHENSRVDVRLDAINWMPVMNYEAGRREVHCFVVGARRHRPESEVVISSSESSSSWERFSSDAESSESEMSQIDLDHVLDEVLATPLNRMETGQVVPRSECRDVSSNSEVGEVVNMDRRLQCLIKSYCEWAGMCSGRRRQGERRAATSSSCDSPEPEPTDRGTRGLAVSGRSAEDTLKTDMLALSSKHRSQFIRTVRTAQGGGNDRPLALFSPDITSRQDLISRGVRLPGSLFKERRNNVLSCGTIPARRSPPVRKPRLLLEAEPSSHEPNLFQPPPADAKAPLIAPEVAERLLLIVTDDSEGIGCLVARARAQGAGDDDVTRVDSASIMLLGVAEAILGEPEVGFPNAPPPTTAGESEPTCPEGTGREKRQPVHEPLVVCIPRRKPVISSDRPSLERARTSTAQEVLIASGRKSGESDVQGSGNKQRHSPKGKEKSSPALARVDPQLDAHRAVHSGLPCRDIVVSTSTIASEYKAAERSFCHSMPSPHGSRFGELPNVTDPGYRDTASAENKEEAKGFRPPRNSREFIESIREDTVPVISVKSGIIAGTLMPRFILHRDDKRYEAISCVRNEAALGREAEHTGVQAEAPVLSTGIPSSFVETSRLQPHRGLDRCNNGSGRHPLQRCDAKAGVVATGFPELPSEEIIFQQSQVGRRIPLAPRNSHSSFQPTSMDAAGFCAVRDAEEIRIVPRATAISPVRTLARKSTKVGLGGDIFHPKHTPLGEVDCRCLEPWCNNIGKPLAMAYRQEIGHIKTSPARARPLVPRLHRRAEADVSSRAAVLIQDDELVNCRGLSEDAEGRQTSGVISAPSRTESECLSRNVSAYVPRKDGTVDQNDDGENTGSSELVPKHLAGSETPETDCELLSALNHGKDISSVSPQGTSADLGVFPEKPEPPPETPPPSSSAGEYGSSLAIPLACLFVPPPASPNLVRVVVETPHSSARPISQRLQIGTGLDLAPRGMVMLQPVEPENCRGISEDAEESETSIIISVSSRTEDEYLARTGAASAQTKLGAVNKNDDGEDIESSELIDRVLSARETPETDCALLSALNHGKDVPSASPQGKSVDLGVFPEKPEPPPENPPSSSIVGDNDSGHAIPHPLTCLLVPPPASPDPVRVEVGAFPRGARWILPRLHRRAEADVSSRAAVLCFPVEPVNCRGLSEDAEGRQTSGVISAPSRTESECLSRNVSAYVPRKDGTVDQNDDGENTGSSELVSKHLAGSETPETDCELLSALNHGKDISSASPQGTSVDLVAFPNKTETKAKTPPSPILLAPPPTSPDLLRARASAEVLAHGIKHEDTKQVTPEPTSTVRGDVATRKKSTAGSILPERVLGYPAHSPQKVVTPQSVPLPLPSSPPALRPQRAAPPTIAVANASLELSSGVEHFSTVRTLHDIEPVDDQGASPIPVVPWRRPEDREISGPVFTPAKPVRGENSASVDAAPTAVTHLERRDAVSDYQASRYSFHKQQAEEPASDLGSCDGTCSRSSAHSDSSSNTSTGRARRRQRHHHVRYPPPPAPPPSPTRGNTCTKWGGGSLSPTCQRGAEAFLMETGADTAVEAIAVGGVPAGDMSDGRRSHAYSSPRPAQAKSRSATVDALESGALFDLKGEALCWLPPPTPPPEEARRRRRSARTPSPASRTTRPGDDTTRTRLAPFFHSQGVGDGEKHGRRGDAKEQEGDGHPRAGADPTSEHIEANVSQRENLDDGRWSIDATVGTTQSAPTRRSGDKGGDESLYLLRDDCPRRRRGSEGGWAGSYEGSAAKKRADEILARITALEVSFDRVEEEAMPLLANVRHDVTAGESGRESVSKGLESALDVEPAAGVAASRANRKWTIDETTHVPACSAGPTEVVGSKDSRGQGGDRPWEPVGLSNEVSNRVPQEDCESNEALCSAVSASPKSNSGKGVKDGRVAAPLTVGELDKSKTRGVVNNRQREFYFNLGRSMMLASIGSDASCCICVVDDNPSSLSGRDDIPLSAGGLCRQGVDFGVGIREST